MSGRLAGLAIALAAVTLSLAAVGGLAKISSWGDIAGGYDGCQVAMEGAACLHQPDSAIEERGTVACLLPVTIAEDGCADWKAQTPSDSARSSVDVEVGPDGRVFTLDRGQSPPDHPTEEGYDMRVIAYEEASGQTLWEASVGRPVGDDGPVDIEVGAEGELVFVSGASSSTIFEAEGEERHDYMTSAFDAATGEVVWEANTTGEPANVESDDGVVDAAVSKKGVILVTGYIGAETYRDWLTVARDTETGEALWSHRVAGSETELNGDKTHERPKALDVSPDGSVAVAAGQLDGEATAVAFDVKSGEVLWQSKLDVKNSIDPSFALDVVVGDGQAHIRLLDKWDDEHGTDRRTGYLRAVDIFSGETAWLREVEPARPASYGKLIQGSAEEVYEHIDDPMVLDESASTLYVTHASSDGQVTAFDTSSGDERWTAPYRDPVAHTIDHKDVRGGYVWELGLSDDGSRLFAVGYDKHRPTYYLPPTVAIRTQAYEAATGAVEWKSTHGGTQSARTTDVGAAWIGGLAVGDNHAVVHGWLDDLEEGPRVTTLAYDHGGPTFPFAGPPGLGLPN